MFASQPLSPDAYLEAEKSSLIKHEYHNGEVYAMAGASDEHVTIGINLTALLRQKLRGSGCRIYGSDMKVHIKAFNRYYYPDGLVSCDLRDRQFRYAKEYPTVIFEILSKGTEAQDRGQKFEHYRTLATLQEYVLINQDRQQVETFRKNLAGLWVLHPSPSGSLVELASLDITLNMAELYEDVTFMA
ncbi:MAG: Uma2 family endonuclease, partial [Cyanobacteria bacterium P01_C01_bin.73]